MNNSNFMKSFYGLDLSNILDECFTALADGSVQYNPNASKTRNPSVKAVRTEKVDTFYVELPGVKREDIQAIPTGEYKIVITAKRNIDDYNTSFATELVSDKDIDHAVLTYADGLLTVKIEPKPVVEPETRKLNIQ